MLKLLSTACALLALVQRAGALIMSLPMHISECKYRRMAEVMGDLDAASDQLLDEDGKLLGCVKDVKEMVKKDQAKSSAETCWRWRVDQMKCSVCCTSMYLYIPVCTCMYLE